MKYKEPDLCLLRRLRKVVSFFYKKNRHRNMSYNIENFTYDDATIDKDSFNLWLKERIINCIPIIKGGYYW